MGSWCSTVITQPIFCLVGPSGSGKTQASIKIAQRWPIEIINVDSGTIYRDMDIGTAKPSVEQQKKTKQHLLDIKDASEHYSCAEFLNDATSIISKIRKRGRIPFLVGGTMLYFRVLSNGLAKLPSSNMSIRHAIESEAKQKGWPALHEELGKYDPQTANRLAVNDKQRIQRAIEVYRSTGFSISNFFSQKDRRLPRVMEDCITISLEPLQRDSLFQHIEKRFDKMIDSGLVDEVYSFYRRKDLSLEFPSMRCIGYRQFWRYLDGEIDWKLARSRSILATRKLIKNQMNWLKAQPNRTIIECLKKDSSSKIVDIFSESMKKINLSNQ